MNDTTGKMRKPLKKFKLPAPIFSEDEDDCDWDVPEDTIGQNEATTINADRIADHGPDNKRLKLTNEDAVEIANKECAAIPKEVLTDVITLPLAATPLIESNDKGTKLWNGVLEWFDRAKAGVKVVKQIPCEIFSNAGGNKEAEPFTAINWPSKLTMQLIPKRLLSLVGSTYIKNSKFILFSFPSGDNYEYLVKLMNPQSSCLVGCVRLLCDSKKQSNVKILILLYTKHRQSFVGFIPNEQTVFMIKLFKIIKEEKEEILVKKEQSSIKEEDHNLDLSPINTLNTGTEEPNSSQEKNTQTPITILTGLDIVDRLTAERRQISENIDQLTRILEDTKNMETAYKTQLEKITSITKSQLRDAISILQQTDSRLAALKDIGKL